MKKELAISLALLLTACSGGSGTGGGEDIAGQANRPPVAVADAVQTPMGTSKLVDVLSNDTDPDGDALVLTTIQQPAHGTAYVDFGITAGPGDDRIIYTPDAEFSGDDSIAYSITDGFNGHASGFVNIAVLPPPIPVNSAKADSAATAPNTPMNVYVLGNDEWDGVSSLAIGAVTAPVYGTTTIEDNGTGDPSDDYLRYVPTPGFVGTDSFVYSLTTGQSAVVHIVVNADPTAPAGATIVGSIVKGPVRASVVRFYRIDPDGGRMGSAIAQSVTDEKGRFTAIVPLPRTDLIAVAFGGHFVDETDSRPDTADRRVIAFGQQEILESVLPASADYVAINAYTNAIARKAARIAAPGQFASRYAQLRNEFEIALGFDPVTTAPTNPAAPDPASSVASRQYALALGGIATALNKIAVQLGQPAMSYPLISGVVDDLSRCLLDGVNDAGQVTVLLDGQLLPLPDNVDLNTEILRFRNNKMSEYVSTPLLQLNTQGCDGTSAPPLPPPDNDSPTALSIDIASVNENSAPGTPVGTFSTTDANPDDVHVYTLVAGPGDSGNGNFTISGDRLITSAVFDFETQPSYSIRVRTDDSFSVPFERVFIVTVNDLNESPTSIGLEPGRIDENLPIGTLVGELEVDDDVGDDHSYALVAGPGDTDNGSFTIVDDELRTDAVFDFETRSSFSIRVRADDMVSAPIEAVLVILVTDVNEAPTASSLDATTINENVAAGTVIGTFAATDDDPGDSHAYTLIAGPGDSGNGSFNIVGDQLVSGAPFDFEAQASYSIRVRTDDSVTTPFDRNFTINVNDVNEAPTASSLDATTINENLAAGTVIGTFAATDDDPGDSHAYTLIAGPGDSGNGSFNIVGDQLVSGAPFDFEAQASYSIRVRTDDSVTTPFDRNFTINVNDVNEAPTASSLDATTINENLAAGTVIGTFAATDDDPGDSHAYTLIAGPGDSGNGSFNIVGDQLVSGAPFDFEAQASYSIRVRTDDSVTTPFDRNFTINVNDVNEAPTASSLDATTINENLAAGTVIGTFAATDDDPGDSHAYTLIAGPGDSGNGSFNIVGDQLVSGAPFDFEAQASYSIRVRTDDSVTTPFDRNFTINVNDVNEAPEPNDDSALTPVDGPVAIDVLANDSDPDGDPISIAAVDSPTPAGGTAAINDNATPGDPSDDYIDYSPQAGFEGDDTFSYTVSDGSLVWPASITVTVSDFGYVDSITPANGARAVPVTQSVQIVFTQAMNAATLDGSTLVLSTSASGTPPLAAGVTYNPGTLTATIDPSADLDPATVYFVVISDLIENAMGQPQGFQTISSFTVALDPTDTDSDGLADADEGAVGGCPDPTVADSDGDDVGDGAEVAAGGDPCGDQGQTVWYIDDDGAAGGWPAASTTFGGFTSGTPGNPNYVLVAEGTYLDEINYASNCDYLVFTGSQDPAAPGAIVRNPDGSPTTIIDMEDTRNSELAGCAEVKLQDIHLTGGIGNGGDKGGGIRVSTGTTAYLDRVWLTNNTTGDQGGGLGVSNASVATVTSSVIRDNLVTAGKGGGGVWVGANATLNIADTLVVDNTAAAAGGGGLYFDPRSTGTVANTYVVDNATSGSGGGIFVLNNDTTVVNVTDSVITSNFSATSGGGVYAEGNFAGASAINISHNRIVDNAAPFGGGIMLESTDAIATAVNNLVLGNAAWFGGAGIHSADSAPPLLNNTILYNRTAQATGAAIAATGAGMPVIRDSIIWANRAGSRPITVGVTPNDNYTASIVQSDFNLLEVDKIGASDVDFVNDGVTPGFEAGFYLNQLTSVAVDTGSDTALFLTLDSRFTDKAGTPDGGTVDRGFHHPLPANYPADGYIETGGATNNEITVSDADFGPNAVVLLIRPLASGIPLGPGHLVVATLEGANSALAQLSDTAGVDVLGNGESVILSDLGNGDYRAFIEPESSPGTPTAIPLRIYIDELIQPIVFNIDRVP